MKWAPVCLFALVIVSCLAKSGAAVAGGIVTGGPHQALVTHSRLQALTMTASAKVARQEHKTKRKYKSTLVTLSPNAVPI